MANTTRKELFSERVHAGSRTYFFDVKEATDGTRYLSISEYQPKGEERDHRRVMVFAEHVPAFRAAVERVTDWLQNKKVPDFVAATRQKHPKAYEPWTMEDDERLRDRYQEGFDIPALARVFQRKEGAIESRLKRLGLYGREEKR
jgi:hypothetical protein